MARRGIAARARRQAVRPEMKRRNAKDWTDAAAERRGHHAARAASPISPTSSPTVKSRSAAEARLRTRRRYLLTTCRGTCRSPCLCLPAAPDGVAKDSPHATRTGPHPSGMVPAFRGRFHGNCGSSWPSPHRCADGVSRRSDLRRALRHRDDPALQRRAGQQFSAGEGHPVVLRLRPPRPRSTAAGFSSASASSSCSGSSLRCAER